MGGAKRSSERVWLFALQLAYLAALVALGLAYLHQPALHRFLPDPAGPVPLGVPWWGALGGVTISFTGIFRNARRWDGSYQITAQCTALQGGGEAPFRPSGRTLLLFDVLTEHGHRRPADRASEIRRRPEPVRSVVVARQLRKLFAEQAA